MSTLSLLRDTWSALLAPRRAAAVTLVAIPLLLAQAAWNEDPRSGVLAGLTLILGTLAVAPAAWRALSPHPLRYGLVCLLATLVLALLLPRWSGFEDRFLTHPVTLPLVFGLLAVAGYGLGRDIEDEGRLQRAEARAEALQRDRERAELLALRAQLDPHFLFNTLSAIAEWCHSDPLVAERAILRLSDLLRAIQSGVQLPSWPLSRELALCRDVLELYHTRDPGRYTYEILGEIPAIQVPPLLLLPLVENAVKHGPAAGHAGPVRIRVQAEGDGVQIQIQNPGPYRGPRTGGEGLALTRRRLSLGYIGSALELGEADGGTRLSLSLPGPPLEAP